MTFLMKMQSMTIKAIIFFILMGAGLGFLGEAMLCQGKIDFLKIEVKQLGLVIQASNK